MIAFARVGGLLCLMAFGAQSAISTFRDRMYADLYERQRAGSVSGFVTLTRAQVREGWPEDRYYFSYNGFIGARPVHGVAQVSSQYFHRNSEGNSVEAFFYVDPGGSVYVRLLGNDEALLRRSPFLTDFSAAVALVSGLIALIAWIWPLRGEHANKTRTPRSDRPG